MDENDISRIRPFHNELSSLCLHLAFIRAFVTLRLTLKNVLFASQEISRFFNKITVRVKLDLFGCLGLCCSSCKTQLTEQKGEKSKQPQMLLLAQCIFGMSSRSPLLSKLVVLKNDTLQYFQFLQLVFYHLTFILDEMRLIIRGQHCMQTLIYFIVCYKSLFISFKIILMS